MRIALASDHATVTLRRSPGTCLEAFFAADILGGHHQHRVGMLSHPHQQTGTAPAGEFA